MIHYQAEFFLAHLTVIYLCIVGWQACKPCNLISALVFILISILSSLGNENRLLIFINLDVNLSLFPSIHYQLMQFGTSSFGASAHYTHRFSSKSHGRIVGKVGRYVLMICLRTDLTYLYLTDHLMSFFITDILVTPLCSHLNLHQWLYFQCHPLYILKQENDSSLMIELVCKV